MKYIKPTHDKLRWIYLVGFWLVLIQLLNIIPPLFTPTDWGKAICFRIIVSFVCLIFLLQILYRKIDINYIKQRIKPIKIPFIFLLCFLGYYFISTLLSPDVSFSLWGGPFRNGGFVNLAFYIIFTLFIFLIMKKKDWEAIWFYMTAIGLIVSLIAIFQQTGMFKNFLIPFDHRPVSTMANPILLAIYLLLMFFPTLVFAIREKNLFSKIFYSFSSLFFLFICIFITQTRGVLLGIIIGFLWMFFAYPKMKKKLKIFVLFIFLMLLVFAKLLDSNFYLLNGFPEYVKGPIGRAISLVEGPKMFESRISAWKISSDALKEKPIFGYGPENFTIAFDKHYDPSLPIVGPGGDAFSEWFDRAHNFLFEYSINAGLPALFLYLAFFISLIWQLQKIKKNNSDDAITANGLQAAFIGYLVALLSGFDSVSTYITSFFLIGYSFFIIGRNYKNLEPIAKQKFIALKYKPAIAILLTIIFAWFTYYFNIKPLVLVKDVNMALDYSGEVNDCTTALKIADNLYDKLLNQTGIIDGYLEQKTAAVYYKCIDEDKNRSSKEIIKKAINLMQKASNNHPAYLINWYILAQYNNILLEEINKENENNFISNQETQKIKSEAEFAFNKSSERSPKRQTILRDWAKTEIITADYEKAEEKLNQCINLNSNYSQCYWFMALTKGYKKNYSEFDNYLSIVKKRGYDTESKESLQQIIDMYIRNNDYSGLVKTYIKLIEITNDPLNKAQLYASLAASYKELKDIKSARESVLKINSLIPFLPKNLQQSVKNDVDNFLKMLQ